MIWVTWYFIEAECIVYHSISRYIVSVGAPQVFPSFIIEHLKVGLVNLVKPFHLG